MSVLGDRRTVRFDPSTGQAFELEYQFPLTDKRTGARTATLEPIGTADIVQHLGQKATRVTFRGHCYEDEAQQIEQLTEFEQVQIRSQRFTGVAVVETAETMATGSGGGKRPDITNRQLDYRIDASQVNP